MKKGELARLREENRLLRQAIEDCWYCARRYCDGRSTGITWTYNGHTRILQKLMPEVMERVAGADGTLWARDGMGRKYDSLTDEEAALGMKPEFINWNSIEGKEFQVMRAAVIQHWQQRGHDRCDGNIALWEAAGLELRQTQEKDA